MTSTSMTNKIQLRFATLIPLLTGLSLSACIEVEDGDADASGGASSDAGTGGAGTGGTEVGSGGGNSGGTAPGSGGGSSGGSIGSGGGNAGGGPGTGGGNSGGDGPTGGSDGTGGDDGSGGDSGGGGNVTGSWGTEENPSAECTIGALPDFGSLTADPKLPDPFMKMDGTRMTDKSEWVCRREEILQQGYEFILGEKPVPPEGATTGTVDESEISVSVNDGGSTTFTVEVNMNGATAPAPAMISYGGGAPTPSGVARITFQAIESQGGSGAKTGPFFDVYGSDHPAGYMVAQAWQISRIIDVLEQDPSVIDPTKIALTGCSRNGKGAFFGGVLDNRVALTIPVESGLGGTVGLRLVEVLGGGEWPYHGISYVRWLSEVALGPFTSGNSAGADDTALLPVDMHEMMALIAPRGLYIVDNPSTTYAGLDREAAWVTGNVGKMIFEGLGVGDHFSYQGASGGHCSWRTAYDPSLNAMIDKFLLGNDSASTGNVDTDFSGPDPSAHIDWDVPNLTGDL